jgi:hypothetical protein
MFIEWSSTTLGFLFRYEIQNGGYCRTWFNIGKMFQNASSLKPLAQLKPNFPGMIIGRSSTHFLFFYADRKSKMAATAGHRLTLDPMGKCSNAFFSGTTNMIKLKLYMNVHWMVNLCPAVVAILYFRSA